MTLAGKQAGIKEGTRSGLFYELMRVVRLVRPQYVVLENVSAILANGLDTVLGTLAEAGFDAEWACIPASAVGACHQRDRWWLVAYSAKSPSNGSSIRSAANSETNQQRQRGELGGIDSVDVAYPSSQGQQGQEPAWRHAAGSLCPNWRSYLSEPVLCRGDDGLSGRVDRLKALGNAVVPQVAAIPLARVRELADAQRTNNPTTHPHRM